MEYQITLEVQTPKALTQNEQDDLREEVLRAIDRAKLPFGADVATASVQGPV